MPKHFMIRRCVGGGRLYEKTGRKQESHAVVDHGNKTTKSGNVLSKNDSSDLGSTLASNNRDTNHPCHSDISQDVCNNLSDDNNIEDLNQYPSSTYRIGQINNNHIQENEPCMALSAYYNTSRGSNGQRHHSIPTSGQSGKHNLLVSSMAMHNYGGFPDNISPKSAASVNELSPSFPISANIPKDKSTSSDDTIQNVHEKRVFNFDSEDILPLTSSVSVTGHLTFDNSAPLGRSTGVSVATLAVSNLNLKTDKTTESSATLSFPYMGLQAGVRFPVSNNTSPGFQSQAKTTILPKTKSQNILSSKQKEVTKKFEYINGGFGIKNPILTSSTIHHEPQYKKIKTYKCNICEEIFQKQSQLARHLKDHGNIKRYLCSFCVKGFDDKFDLKRHTRTHTGVKPFKCSDCSKSFTQRCSLEAHGRKVHARNLVYRFKERREKLHVCEDCGNITEDANQHYEHLKLQHPTSPLLEKYYDRRQFKSMK